MAGLLDFLNRPETPGLLTNLGMGMMAAGQPLQPGQTRLGVAMPFLRQAAQVGQQVQDAELRGLQLKQARQKASEAERQAVARGALANDRPAGLDPRTGIDWKQPRLPGSERRGLLSQAYPDAFGKAMMEQAFPKTTVSPSGFKPAEDGLAFQKGGPADPEYLRSKAEATRAPEQRLALERKLALAGIDPQSPEGQKLIRADLAGQEMHFTQGPEGGFSLSMGKGVGGGAGELSKPTQTSLERDLIGAREGLARLDQIQSGFQEKFQQIPHRVGTAVTALKEKLTMGTVTPEEQAELYEYTQFTRDAIENINLYIKDITGAQMAVTEAARLTRGMPNPGDGILTGDSPTEFRAKMDSVVTSLRAAAARNAYALQNGLFADLPEKQRSEALARTIPLSGMKEIMNARADELRASIRANNPNIDQAALDDFLRRQLAEEFGLLGK